MRDRRPWDVDSHDLERAAGCVEELNLTDAPLRDGVESGPAPTSLHQTDGFSCDGIRTESMESVQEKYEKCLLYQRDLNSLLQFVLK